MIEAAEQHTAQLVLFAEERRRKLLERLSKVDSKHRHRRLKESRHDGTGAWFTSCSEYEQWKGASQSSVLCCYGIPGCGKSVLVSSVIDSFHASGTLVFYYCDYSDKRTLEPSNVFATLARQALEQVDILPETLAAEIEQVDHDGEKLINPSKALVILQKSLELVRGPIFLVLDGLDEATEPSQVLICNSLRQLIEKSGLCVKLFITGRDELGSLLILDPSIPHSRVPVSPSAISLDIENYVRASTRRRISDGLLVIGDPDLEQLIVEELVKGAKGMFLWVEFQLHDLCEPESDHGIRLVLQNLPRSLGETYERLLSKIDGVERRDMIQRMFKWIVCAREPIHLDEMREAVAFTLDDLSYDPRKLPTDLNRLVRACGNLVVVDKETHVVQLAHHTVQQYLLEEHCSPFQFTVKDANVMAGEFCVAYLSFSNFESQVTRYAENKNTDMLTLGKIASRGSLLASDHPAQKVVHVLNGFRNPRSNALDINMTRYVPPQRNLWQPTNFGCLSYVVAHWLWHTRFFDAIGDSNIEEKTRRSRLFKNLVLRKQLLLDFRPWGDINSRETPKIAFIALLGWALMANHGYLIHVTSSDVYVPFLRDAWHATCSKYSWAWEIRDKQILYLLPAGKQEPHLNHLDPDYDFLSLTLDAPDLVWLFSRLLRACQEGHTAVIRAVEFRFRTDDLSMVEYLAAAAAARGQLEVVKYLWEVHLDHHRLYSSRGLFLVASHQTRGYALTAIEHAAISGYSHIVSYLADHEAWAEIILCTPGVFHKFFDEAIIHNVLPTIESLLTLWKVRYIVRPEIAFSPTIEQYLSNTLINAIVKAETELVRTLLKNGVDPDSSDKLGYTPLVQAIRHSRDSVVSILLEHGCSLGNTTHGMPLTIAACQDNIGIFRELLLHHVDVFGGESIQLQNLNFFLIASEFMVASKDMRSQTVRIDPTPLYMACYHGHLNIVELLLSYGAASNVPSPKGIIYVCKTALDTVEFSYLMLGEFKYDNVSMSEDLIRWLPSAEGSWKLPITAAIERGHTDIVHTLLSAGALWPEEFEGLFGSCLGSLDSELERFTGHVYNALITRSVPQTGAAKLPLRQNAANIRTFMTEMGLPIVTASRIYSVAELKVLNSVHTASQLEALKVSERERLKWRNSDLKGDILSGLPGGGEDLQARLISFARDWYTDSRRNAKIQVLVDAGVSLTTCYGGGVVVPNFHLIEAARCGNSILHHALLDLMVASTFSPLEESGESIDRETLAHMIQQILAPKKRLGRPTNRVYQVGKIIKAATQSNGEKLVRRLYEILVFAFRNPVPGGPSAALFAAVDHENQGVIELLCKYRADFNINVDVRDYNGGTPLLYAVERGASVSMIATLLSHGADPRLADNDGETLLYKATASHDTRILDSLMNVDQHGQYYMDKIDLRNALDLCISMRKSETWNNLTKAVRARHPIATYLPRLSYEPVTIMDGHPDKPIPWLLHRTWPEPNTTSYERARGKYLSRRPCQCVEGLFELSAVQDEIEAPPSPVPPIHVEKPEKVKRLSKAAAALLERDPDADLLADLESMTSSTEDFYATQHANNNRSESGLHSELRTSLESKLTRRSSEHTGLRSL